MSLIRPMDYSSVMPTTDVVNGDQEIMNHIRDSKSGKEQLKKTAKEFEAIFIAKTFSLMDQTVDKEGGIFGEETKYFDNLKSYMYDEMGRQMSNSPHTSFGFAKQIYEQMEKYVKE